MLNKDGYSTADVIYNWKQDDKGSIKSAVGVSRETTSIKFNVAAVNTKQEIVQLGTS